VGDGLWVVSACVADVVRDTSAKARAADNAAAAM